MYQILKERNDTLQHYRYLETYAKLKTHFQEKLQPQKSVRVFDNMIFFMSQKDTLDIALSLCNSFLYDFNKTQDYIVYTKTLPFLREVIIKVKPTNMQYQNKIIEKSRKKLASSRKNAVVIKRTTDRNLAEWYRRIANDAAIFADQIISIKPTGLMKFEVTININ